MELSGRAESEAGHGFMRDAPQSSIVILTVCSTTLPSPSCLLGSDSPSLALSSISVHQAPSSWLSSIKSIFPLIPAFAKPGTEGVASVLRARSLEIVDAQGKTRAQIVIAPAYSKAGKSYPETDLFRLIDPDGQPTVKMAASNAKPLNKDGGVLVLQP